MNPAKLKNIRKLLWLYFFLLIFEGALRKWFLPGLSTPLLLVRDPVALLALWWGLPLLNQRQWQLWIQSILLLGMASFLLTTTIGHGDIPTALFGVRVMFLQLPLIFLYGAVFDRSDVIKFAWALAWLTIPMTLLIVFQSNLPNSHILNVGVGGEGTSSFDGALGRFRPSGMFSFVNALAGFYTLAAAGIFTLFYGTKLQLRGRLFCALVGIALVVAQPVSMSRSLLAGYLQVFAAIIAALALSRTRVFPIISGILALLLIINIATNIPAFKETSEAFNARWEAAAAAGDTEKRSDALGQGVGQLQGRVLGGFTEPLRNLEKQPFLGYGIGMGTNFGAQRLSGKIGFTLGEGSWEVSLAEMGVPLGLAFLIWRLALGFYIFRLSIQQAVSGNKFPLIWLGSCFLILINGQISQPTALGMIVVSTGLTLAACNLEIPPQQPAP